MRAYREEFDRLLGPVLEELGLELVRGQMDKLWGHYELLARWNEKVNLTSLRRAEEIVRRHFGESLAVARVMGDGSGEVVDVGSGGGFPGIPIAVCFGNRRVTLVESVGKKAIFLKEVARNHANIGVFEGRFENVEGHFEWGCLRAVAAGDVRDGLKKAVERVAMIVSERSSGEIARGLGLLSVETHILPWDARTAVLTGRIPSST